nr:hypothetical protein [Xenorhabdus bovienii]
MGKRKHFYVKHIATHKEYDKLTKKYRRQKRTNQSNYTLR